MKVKIQYVMVEAVVMQESLNGSLILIGMSNGKEYWIPLSEVKKRTAGRKYSISYQGPIPITLSCCREEGII